MVQYGVVVVILDGLENDVILGFCFIGFFGLVQCVFIIGLGFCVCCFFLVFFFGVFGFVCGFGFFFLVGCGFFGCFFGLFWFGVGLVCFYVVFGLCVSDDVQEFIGWDLLCFGFGVQFFQLVFFQEKFVQFIVDFFDMSFGFDFVYL